LCTPWLSVAHAQLKYQEVACSAVPVTGFDFKRCFQSDIWRKGLNSYISYRLTVVTPESRVTVGYGKPVSSGGFWNIVPENDLINYYLNNSLFRGNLFPVTNVGNLEKHGQDFFFNFEPEQILGRDPFRCKAFVRPGPWKNAPGLGGYEYMSGGFFCRASPSPIQTQEVRFFTDMLTFR